MHTVKRYYTRKLFHHFLFARYKLVALFMPVIPDGTSWRLTKDFQVKSNSQPTLTKLETLKDFQSKSNKFITLLMHARGYDTHYSAGHKFKALSTYLSLQFLHRSIQMFLTHAHQQRELTNLSLTISNFIRVYMQKLGNGGGSNMYTYKTGP